MNSRVWSVDGIDPSVRERAEAAARRAGMSLNDWLSSTLGEATPPNFGSAAPAAEPRPQFSRDVADIHQRLDSITRQIDQMSQGARRSEPAREQGVARQLNDAISRLDARLAQITTPQDPKPVQQQRERQNEAVERAAAQIYRNSPPLSPFDSAVAEIAARQSELDGPPPRAVPPRAAPPIAPQAPVQHDPRESHPREPREDRATAPSEPVGPDFSSLERHLVKITSQIEALQRPSGLEQSIAAFRSELSEIRSAILEAMPRRAIETIESEVRSLARRIDDSRQNTNDSEALANIERALGEIREVLRTLMPAEQLRGYDEAIRNLGAKLDMILRTNDDPGTVQQLESAIAALRSIVSNVASNDALARLAEDVRLLSAKVDQVTRGTDHSDSFAVLEQRIAALTSALENRERERSPSDDRSAQFEDALRGLSDRIDRLQVGNDSAATFAHLEQRVSHLLERIEASNEQRGGTNTNLSRVEDALQDILGHLERQHAAFMRFADNTQRTPEPQDFGLADVVRRELSDIRSRQNETDRQTQDSLEAVHNTLGHVVDRLAMIEGDLRAVRATPAPIAGPAPARAFVEPAPRTAMPPEPRSETPRPESQRPELPNPAAAQGAFVAAPRDFHAAAPPAHVPPQPPLAISEILVPHTQAQPRAAMAPDLPPDHPLEPGTRPGSRPATPSERIAASEDAISEIPAAAPKPPVSSSSFIAAARRAAQAAAAAQAAPEKGRASGKSKSASADKDKKEPAGITAKIRSVLVAASVVVIVLGSFKMAMTLLDGWSGQGAIPAPAPAIESSSESRTPVQAPAANSAAPAPAEQVTPQMTSPTPIGKQSFNNGAAESTASVEIPQAPATAPAPGSNSEITGTIPSIQQLAGSRRLSTIAIPPNEKLPDGLAGPTLRAAALKGDPTAAYEIAIRFADGKGVATNYEEAAKWYDRAAQAGLIPATFRLGTLYEKGLGVKKDADTARRYYLQAAERGNAKAMHNLAVLDADGGGKGPDYTGAAQWFRKAADHGVADSEFNLGILYARGIGVDQNLAESFKWFSLAAAQGDADAGHKRDDIAKRLDAQSLAAARLAVQTFIAEPQPDDAVTVATPPGGWDAVTVPTSAKPAAKPVATKRAAAAPTTAAR